MPSQRQQFFDTCVFVEATFDKAKFFSKAEKLLNTKFRTSNLVLEEIKELHRRRRTVYFRLTQYMKNQKDVDVKKLFSIVEDLCSNANDQKNLIEIIDSCVKSSKNHDERSNSLLRLTGRINTKFFAIIRLIEANQDKILISRRMQNDVWKALQPIFKNESDCKILTNLISVAMFEVLQFNFVTKDHTDFLSKKGEIYSAVYGGKTSNRSVEIIAIENS